MQSAFSIRSPDERADRNKECGKAQEEKADFLVALRALALGQHLWFVDRGRCEDAGRQRRAEAVGLSRGAKELKPLHGL